MQELVLSLQHVGLRDRSLILRVRSSFFFFYLPTHLTGPHEKILKTIARLGMVAHTCNPRTHVAGVGDSHWRLGLQSESGQ